MENINQLKFHVLSGIVAVLVLVLGFTIGISTIPFLALAFFLSSQFPAVDGWLGTLVICLVPSLLVFLTAFLPYLSFDTKSSYTVKERTKIIYVKGLFSVLLWVAAIAISLPYILQNGPT